jgi:excisionase family DNA binding protein
MSKVSVLQMAHMCGVSLRTVYNWIEKGTLTSVGAGPDRRVLVPSVLPKAQKQRQPQPADSGRQV